MLYDKFRYSYYSIQPSYYVFWYYRYGFSPVINSYAAFGFSCTGSENSLSECAEPGAVCATDNADFAIAIECGGQTSPSKLYIIPKCISEHMSLRCSCNVSLLHVAKLLCVVTSSEQHS